MTEQAIPYVLSIPRPVGSAIRSAFTVTIALIAGLAVAQNVSVFNAVPLLAALAIGTLFATPWRPKAIEDFISRGLFSVGAAVLAGELFARGENVAGWALAIVGLAVAIGFAGKTVAQKAVTLGVSMLSAAAGFLAIFGAESVANFEWTLNGLGSTAAVGAGFGLVAWAGTKLGDSMTLERATQGSNAPQKLEIGDVDGDDFEHEWDELRDEADRVNKLLDGLERSRPEEAGMVDRIRESVNVTMSDAEQSVLRWRLAGRKDRSGRSDRIRARIEDNEARLDAEADNAVRAEVAATLNRQRKTLEAHERIESGRRSFGFRLQQVQAGFEMLELAVEQTLTGSRDLQSSDVDVLVEAMQEANEVLNVGLDPIPARDRATSAAIDRAVAEAAQQEEADASSDEAATAN